MKNKHNLFILLFTVGLFFVVLLTFGFNLPKENREKANRIKSFLITNANLWTHPKAMRGGFVKNQEYLDELKKLTTEQEFNLCEIGGLYKFQEDIDGSVHFYCTDKEMIPNAVIVIDRPHPEKQNK